jgi:hypothetical protein
MIRLLHESAPLSLNRPSPTSNSFFSSDKPWFDVVAPIVTMTVLSHMPQLQREALALQDAGGGPNLSSALIYLHKKASMQLRMWHQALSKRQADLQSAEQSLSRTEATLATLQEELQSLSPQQRRSLQVAQAAEADLLAQQQDLEQQRRWVEAKCAFFYKGFRPLSRLIDCHGHCLQETGALLCSLLPTRFCCNNPRCCSMSTASEGFLQVRGQSCVCGGCLMGSRRPVLAPTFCIAAR